MIHLGPDLLAVVWFGSSPTHSPPVSKLTGETQEDWEREATYWLRERGRGLGRSLVLRPQDSFALYKLFNTLCARTYLDMPAIWPPALMSAPPVSYVIPFPTRNTVFFTSPTHNRVEIQGETERREGSRSPNPTKIQIQMQIIYFLHFQYDTIRCI